LRQGEFLKEFFIKSDDEIAEYLSGKSSPVTESVLLRFALNIEKIPSAVAELYPLHFLLYNRLYAVKISYGEKGFYLHLDPMRIRLVALPDGCCYYFPNEGSFCNEPCAHGLCGAHESTVERELPAFDPMRSFYMDMRNLDFGDTDLLEKYRGGIMNHAWNKDEVKSALAFFGFNIDYPGAALIRKRYYELARRVHPDLPDGSSDKMKRLNSNYGILKKAFVF
jgi:hypothetical protein